MTNLKDLISEEYEKGNIVVASLGELQIYSLTEFVKQPIEGILYDLNRSEAVVLTFSSDPKWINDYAACKVIRELKSRVEELEKEVENCGG